MTQSVIQPLMGTRDEASTVSLRSIDLWMRLALALCIMGVVTPFVLLSLFAHPLADDLYAVNTVRTFGPVGAIKDAYTGWSGRYFCYGLISFLIVWFDMHRVFWIVGLFTLMSIFSAIWVFIRVVTCGQLSAMQALLAAGVAFAIYLTATPHTATAFYFLNGMASTQLPIVLLLLVLSILLHDWTDSPRITRVAALASALVMTFCIAGSYETPALLTLYYLTIGTAIAWWLRSRARLAWLLCTVVCVIGLTIVLIAPGNVVRSAHYPHARNLMHAVDHAVFMGIRWLTSCVLNPAMIGASILFMPAAMKLADRVRDTMGSRHRVLMVIPLLWLAMPCLSFFPALYVMGSAPPPRTLNSIYPFILLGYFASIVALFASMPRSTSRQSTLSPAVSRFAVFMLMLALVGHGNFYTALTDLKSRAMPYHEAIVQRERLIAESVAAGVEHVTVPALPTPPATIFVEDLSTDPGFWINVHAAEYYGVKSIALASDEKGQQQPVATASSH